MKIEVSVSLLSADFGKLAEAISLSEKFGVDRLHIDVMDGHFVPNITIGPVVLAAVRKYTKLPIAAHLMIEHPWDYIDDFINAGADLIGIHAECYGERRASCREYGQYPKEVDAIDVEMVRRDLQRIRDRGKKACLVINPGTPVGCLERVLGEVDSVLVMSVNPGFSGQKFIVDALGKIKLLREKFDGDIAVDGGINGETVEQVVRAGANVLVTASYFFNHSDPAGVVRTLKGLQGV
ncbi:MAG: ribulose-phosphate 3-epimerase [Candidatus Omnitrophica bacterium]|nr:ribulose-phosphate 3-epimerase [Candidatus Omnitrophota bacterium]